MNTYYQVIFVIEGIEFLDAKYKFLNELSAFIYAKFELKYNPLFKQFDDIQYSIIEITE